MVLLCRSAYSQGEHEQHTSAKQRFQHVAWTDWYTLAYTKGELIQRFQQVLRGSMDSGMFIKEREYLGPPFALDVKGG